MIHTHISYTHTYDRHTHMIDTQDMEAMRVTDISYTHSKSCVSHMIYTHTSYTHTHDTHTHMIDTHT